MDNKEKLKKLNSWIWGGVSVLLIGSSSLFLKPPAWLGMAIIVICGIVIIPLVIVLIKYIKLEKKIKISEKEEKDTYL